MARRAVLRDVRGGLRSPRDVCDAHPELVRAGANIGRDVAEDCPICDEPDLRHVTYVFSGKGRGTQSGRAVRREALADYADRHGDCTVYTVEVCLACRWHHLVESLWLTPRGARVG